MHRAWLIVQDVDPAVADLQDINVAGEGRSLRQRHLKAEIILKVPDVLWCEIYRYLNRYSDRIRHEHEALDLVMPAFIMGHRLEREVRNARGEILLLDNFDASEVEGVCCC